MNVAVALSLPTLQNNVEEHIIDYLKKLGATAQAIFGNLLNIEVYNEDKGMLKLALKTSLGRIAPRNNIYVPFKIRQE